MARVFQNLVTFAVVAIVVICVLPGMKNPCYFCDFCDICEHFRVPFSPVPELSFLPVPYRAEPGRAKKKSPGQLACACSERRHFFPRIRGKTIFGSTFQIGLLRDFLNNKKQATFFYILSVKKHVSNAKSQNQWNFTSATLNDIPFFFTTISKGTERNLCQDLLTTESTDSDLKVHALCKWPTGTRQTFLSKPFANSLKIQKQDEECLGKY